MRTILTVPNNILSQKSVPILEINSVVRALAAELCGLLGVKHDDQIFVGVSAPQVGELVRMFAYRANPYSEEPSTRVVINPELVYSKGIVKLLETCLSVPRKEFFVLRHKVVKIRGLTLDGVLHSFKGSGVIAQVFEHELGHLDGVLIDQIGKESSSSEV